MSIFKERTIELIRQALPDELQAELDLNRLVEVPPDPTLGDFAFPAFSLAKILRKAPAQIAQDIAAEIEKPVWLERVAVVGGYVNFFIEKGQRAHDVLTTIAAQKESYGSTVQDTPKTVVIDFSSPNIAKPVGVALIRTTILGHSLARIFSFRGYQVERVNHLGDWGTQCGKWIVGYRMWGDEEQLRLSPIKELFRLYVRFHKEAEVDPALEDAAREAFARLEQGDPEIYALWERFRSLSIEEFKTIYARMGITFDSYNGEAFYEDKMAAVVSMLTEKGLLQTSEGAKIVNLDDENLPPCLIQKSDGATLYATRDLAAAIYRWHTYQPTFVLYVVGAPQQLHFQQVFAVLRKAGMQWVDRYEHIPFGTIRFGDQAMSTRRGNVVFLEDVLNEASARALAIIEARNPNLAQKEQVAEQIGIGAVLFRFLVYSRMKDISFDFASALSFEGDTGPYVQYTYARAGSVLRKAAQVECNSTQLDYAGLNSAEEMTLIKELERFPDVVEAAEAAREPAGIAHYLLELCRAFNGFYHEHRVVGSNLEAERLELLRATRTVIANGLFLLGLEAPEEM
ncbi:MAG TPA: arginine--tRNA ligase [Firmicutes bacterium]|jgi:arginyl-tRNA synthetase|nr:arginine--tRNA ligase [Bacillota bacterium]